MVKKFHAFHGTRRLITGACHHIINLSHRNPFHALSFNITLKYFSEEEVDDRRPPQPVWITPLQNVTALFTYNMTFCVNEGCLNR